MGSMGTVGVVDVEIQANSGDAAADIEAFGSTLSATAAKAKAAGDAVAASVAKMRAETEKARFAAMMADQQRNESDKLTAAQRERMLVQFQREEAARRTALGLQIDATRAAARADELAAMKTQMLADANGKLGLSANAVVAKFQLMGREVSESMSGIGEKIAATAEKAELSADGIAAAFSGIGAIVGAGAAGAFMAHTLDDVAELNVKLADLHEKTGMAVQDLAGLRLIAQSKGLDFDTIAMGLTRLGKAMYEAKQGMQEDREAFAALHISMEEVNTLSVEQMFYRVSKAMAENKSLAVSDGTALELFGRGGKELIPMLRELGEELQEMMKQQGKLTGFTDESAEASQRWLRATSDLSAQFHAGLIPVLEDIVKLLPYIETGFHLLGAGAEITLGSLINYGITLIDVLTGVGKVVDDIAHRDFKSIASDWKEMLATNDARWKKEDQAIKSEGIAAGVAWNSRGGPDLLHTAVPDQNRYGNVDGALMKQARQELATMERKHAMTKAQIVAFWKEQLAKAKPGTTDYEQVNLQLGNLMQHQGASAASAAAKKQMEGFQQGMADMKNAHAVSVADEYLYWAQMRKATRAGSANYVAVSREMANAYQGVLREQETVRKQYASKLDLIAPRPFVGFYGQSAPMGEMKRPQGQSAVASPEDAEHIHSQTKEQVEWLKSLNDQISVQRSLSDVVAETSIKLAEARGQMSKMDAAEALAALHANEYSGALARLQASAEYIRGLSGLPVIDKNKQLGDVQKQIDQLNGAHAVRAMEDQAAINESSLSGSVRRTMDMYVEQATDTAAQVSEILTDAFSGVNSSLSHSLMAHAYNGQEYRRNIVGGLSNTSRGIGSQVLDSGFKQIEGSTLGKFGLGPKSKLGESEGNAMWVRMATAGGGLTHTTASAVGDFMAPMTRARAAVHAMNLPSISLPTFGPSAPGGDWDSMFSGGKYSMPNGVDLGDVDSTTPGSTTVTKPGQSGWGNTVQSIVGSALKFLPHFAAGGPIPSNMPSIVGENGPEVFMPSSAGRIVPNSEAFGASSGGDTHFHIDARGATDPAATEMAIHRALTQWTPHVVKASAGAVRESHLRRPSGAR